MFGWGIVTGIAITLIALVAWKYWLKAIVCNILGIEIK